MRVSSPKSTASPAPRPRTTLREIYKEDTDLANYISVLKKENHSALVESYNLNLYPTLLIVGP